MPPMDVLKNWMLETWKREGGALIDNIKLMEDTPHLSYFDSDSGGGLDCNELKDITNEDLEYVEATTHLDMSFCRESSSLPRISVYPYC